MERITLLELLNNEKSKKEESIINILEKLEKRISGIEDNIKGNAKADRESQKNIKKDK